MQNIEGENTGAVQISEPVYDDKSIRFLEAIWGKGRLSPGGNDEIDRLVQGLEFDGKDVLDIGCGSGGNTIYLAKTKPLKHITGYDVEQAVINYALANVAPENLGVRVSFLRGIPGPLPFASGSTDIVFSKDALIHIPDKEAVFAEFYRVMRPGGHLVVSDWLVNPDGDMSDAMQTYIDAEDIGFEMASPARYRSAMAQAGFAAIKIVNRNLWYLQRAREELHQMSGPMYRQLCIEVGAKLVDKNIKTWTLMLTVLETGEHCPAHLFATKPAN